MQCLKCQHENPSDAKFCNQCGRSLTVSAETLLPAQSVQLGADSESQFYKLILAVRGLLQQERRVTYRKLKSIFGVDDACLREVQQELSFQQVASDEDGKGLVWRGAALAPGSSTAAVTSSQPATVEASIVPSTAVPAPSSTEIPTAINGSTVSSEVPSTDTSSHESAVSPDPLRSAPEAERRQLKLEQVLQGISLPLEETIP